MARNGLVHPAYVNRLEAENAKLREQRDALADGLRWFVNLCHNLGKNGGSPMTGEWEDAREHAEIILAELGDSNENHPAT